MSDHTSHRRKAARQERTEQRLTMREARRQQQDYPELGLDLWGGPGKRQRKNWSENP